MWLEKKIFSLLGWRADIKIELPDKCVACIAPHTSNWDFFYCVLFKEAYRIKVNFLIKEEWTKSVIGGLIRRLGGIGIRRDKSYSSTDIYAKAFDDNNQTGQKDDESQQHFHKNSPILSEAWFLEVIRTTVFYQYKPRHRTIMSLRGSQFRAHLKHVLIIHQTAYMRKALCVYKLLHTDIK